MAEICCILDTEGFSVKEYDCCTRRYTNKFLIRELAYTKISSSDVYEVKCYHFDLRDFDLGSFAPEDVKTIDHQEKIHGLPFYPGRIENENSMFHHSTTKKVLLSIYNRCCSGERRVIAYKGGNFERDILNELGIPSVNLENYKCPSFNALLKENPSYAQETCGSHPPGGKWHCAKAEVSAFRDWVMSELFSGPMWYNRY